jgi:hypothetical protein
MLFSCLGMLFLISDCDIAISQVILIFSRFWSIIMLLYDNSRRYVLYSEFHTRSSISWADQSIFIFGLVLEKSNLFVLLCTRPLWFRLYFLMILCYFQGSAGKSLDILHMLVLVHDFKYFQRLLYSDG